MNIKSDLNQPILFYDGVCGLCNRFVIFLLWIDKKSVFKISPLQGHTAKKILPKNVVSNLNSIIVIDQGEMFEKSDAIFNVFKNIGGAWKALLLFKILPLVLRDYLYDIVSSNRYRVFGKYDACKLPDDSFRNRLLP
ncbi:MAG: DUF393 domain-containing protein [Bdellovibrionales bacterium]|nr:DUF393 domain-containing protein [Bdellovibrionales bacterium]